MNDALKLPPHSIQAEQAVLGGLLINPRSLSFVQEILSADDFYRREHRLIFASIEKTAEDSEVDIVTVAECLEADDCLHDVGGLPYLGELHENTPSAKNIGAYARVVSNHAKARQLAAIAAVMWEAGGDTWQTIADNVMTELLSMSGVQRKWNCDIKSAMQMATEAIQAAFDANGLVGVPSGLSRLDSLLGGFHDTDLIIIGARPSMGKTALMLRCVLGGNCSTGIISAEQPRDQLALRMAGMEGRINAAKLRNAQLEPDEWPKLTYAMTKLKDLPIYINDQPGINIAQIRRQARAWKQQHDIKVLFVDYLQKIEAVEKGLSKSERIGDIARGLKDLAKELRIPVVALAQVNREVEKRTDKRPRMGDLYHSSEIEMEADEIILLYRDEVYNEDTVDMGIAELIIDKNRHGPTGFIRTAWFGEYMRFDNLATGNYQDSEVA